MKGRPIILTEAESDRDAQPVRQDLRRAEGLAQEIGVLLALLLLARRNRKGGVTWVNGQYVDTRTRRRVIQREELDGLIDRLQFEVENDLAQFTVQMLGDEITVARWQREIKDRLKPALLIAAVVAVGGVQQMRAADWSEIGKRTRIQYESLNKFATQLKDLSPAKIRARIRHYAASIRVLYKQYEQNVRRRLGKEEAMRHLTPAEHCEPCLEYAFKWIPIELMPPIGSFSFEEDGCAHHCRCFLTYR